MSTRTDSATPVCLPPGTVILIPVYNEESNIEPLLAEVDGCLPGAPVCFVDDGSSDGTLGVLRRSACRYLSLPCNLGVGGAMQAAFRYAWDEGFEFAIRLDGDGQHPPAECAQLVARMARGDVDMTVGSRFLGETAYRGTWRRRAGILGLSAFLSRICQRRVTDPTSGFQMVNRAVIRYFAHHYPADYPEPESLALLSRQGYRVAEVPARFRERTGGVSSIGVWGSVYYMLKVLIALVVDRCRPVNPRYDRQRIEVS